MVVMLLIYHEPGGGSIVRVAHRGVRLTHRGGGDGGSD